MASLSFSQGWLCKALENYLKEQSVWFLPQITAAGGDEQDREKPVEYEVNTVSGWKLLGMKGNKN